MEDKYKKAKKILKQYNQEHILNFYEELDQKQREQLIDQILNTNFEEIEPKKRKNYTIKTL